MKKIKVIRVLGSLINGGAETVTRNQLIYIDKDKFEMAVAVSGADTGAPNADIIKSAGIRINYFGRDNKKNLSAIENPPLFTKIYRKIRWELYVFVRSLRMMRFFLDERPDIIHLHLSVCYLNRLQYKLLQRLTGVRYCYTCHSTPEEKFSTRKERNTADYLVHKCGMKLIALHQDMECELQSMFSTKNTAIIHNGIDIGKFSNCRAKELTRQELGIPENAWVIGHVGRFVPAKNHEFILEVFKKIAEKDDCAYLLLIGEGELKERIQKRVETMSCKDRVVFIPHSLKIPDLMRAMDVFVLPSRREGFVNVLIEAQCSALPCVTSCYVNDETKVSENILYLDLDSDLWVDALSDYKFKKNIPDKSIENFDIRLTTKSLEKLYGGMTDENSLRQDR